MIPFYLFESLLFLIIGLLLVFRSVVIKKLFNFIQQRNLFFIPGIVEIILGLLTLYFRHQTRLLTLVFLVGIILFIDGIFYLIMSDKLSSTVDWILKLEESNYRLYGLFLIIIALGLGASAIITV